jgi:hypothetical protein
VSLINSAIANSVAVIPRPVVKRTSARYIAGHILDDAVATVRDLNFQGCAATIDLLGEGTEDRADAATTLRVYKRVLDALGEEDLDSGVSVTLTYALPKLQVGRSALLASLILGVIWAFWHLPLMVAAPQSSSLALALASRILQAEDLCSFLRALRAPSVCSVLLPPLPMIASRRLGPPVQRRSTHECEHLTCLS